MWFTSAKADIWQAYNMYNVRARACAHLMTEPGHLRKGWRFCYTNTYSKSVHFLGGYKRQKVLHISSRCLPTLIFPTGKKTVDKRKLIRYTISIRNGMVRFSLATKTSFSSFLKKDKKGAWHFCLFLLPYKSSRNCSFNFYKPFKFLQ